MKNNQFTNEGNDYGKMNDKEKSYNNVNGNYNAYDQMNDSGNGHDSGDDNRYQKRKARKRRNYFGSGVCVGIFAGILVAVIVATVVLNAAYRAGYIHIAMNGDVYVQETAVTDEAGVGSEVESKLNAIDNLLDSFYFEDVDSEKAYENIYKAFVDSY